jgi:hypothetical protein
MMVLKRGMRLSVQPVRAEEYARIVELGHIAPPETPAPVKAKPQQPTKKKKGPARTPSRKKVAAKKKLKKKPR